MIMWCATGLSSLSLRAETKGQLWRTPAARCQRLRAKNLWLWRSGTAMVLEELHFSQCAVCAELQCKLDEFALSCG